MSTYQLKLTRQDDTTKTLSFTIPETNGTYRLDFKLPNGSTSSATVVVEGYYHEYTLKINRANGTSVTTPLYLRGLIRPPVYQSYASTTSSLTFTFRNPNPFGVYIEVDTRTGSYTRSALVGANSTVSITVSGLTSGKTYTVDAQCVPVDTTWQTNSGWIDEFTASTDSESTDS